jgi:hypothetical protein
LQEAVIILLVAGFSPAGEKPATLNIKYLAAAG